MTSLGDEHAKRAQESFLLDAPHVVRGRGVLFGDSEALCTKLAEIGHDARPGRVKGSVILSSGAGIQARSLKDSELEWIPQDEASQAISLAAAELARSVADEPKVLDACAGRGIKTDYMRSALGPGAQITACDVANKKLLQAKKLLPEIQTVTADLGAEQSGFEDIYDFVLVDAPCTGFGTMRRRPEIRLDSREPNLYGLMNLQGRILKNVSSHVKPGGILLYAICSFTREEGVDNVQRFLQSDEGGLFEQVPMPEAPSKAWTNPDHSWCTLDGADSGEALADVFYATAFKRKA
jgi:16S rRNA (cytosine967-C5)-methyltransferase